MVGVDDKKCIEEKRKELEDKYPITAAYNSRCSLWQEGFRDGIVSEELYNKARKYYGDLWTYVGD